jgi:3-oxoacyl-[acyl-carrier-protein] synthase II
MMPTMEEPRVVVTGLGAVSPFGIGVDTFWDSLVQGKSAMRPIEGFDATVFRSVYGAEVPTKVYQDRETRAACGNPAEDAACLLELAASEALCDAGVGPVFADSDRVGCVLGTLCAGARSMLSIARSYAANRPLDPGLPVESALVSYQIEFFAKLHNLTGPSTLVSTACASTTDAIGHAFDLIRNRECDRAIAGGADILAEGIHGGFNSLFSVTTQSPRPFDKDRDGFILGEGAGVLYLETLESARSRQAPIYAEVLGYGLSNSAFHLTATSEDGTGEALAIRRALESAGLAPEAIDHINTHGTATHHNDASEIRAIKAVFGSDRRILATANKAAIGHCMGAAGIMEALATILALYRQTVPPTLNTDANEEGIPFDLVTGEARHAAMRYAISESFGFGGACSCAVFARIGD